MYEYFHGKLVENSSCHLVLDVQGIGYKLNIPVSLAAKLPDYGTLVTVYTSWVVREQSQMLYGFGSKQERDLFELLLTLSGIGPKLALALVGHLTIEQLEEAVQLGNLSILSAVPGVGKKTAERLLVDLKGKLKTQAGVIKGASSSKIQDALNALLNLGYPAKHAQLAIKKAIEELSEECELAELIAAALKK